MFETNPEILAAREKLRAKFGEVRTGGKGSFRRKAKSAQVSTATNEAKVMGYMQKIHARPIPVDSVQMICADNTFMVFNNPRFSAAIQGNTYLIQGAPQVKTMQEMLPELMKSLGISNMDQLKAMAAMKGNVAGGDEDVPNLVEGVNFEDVSRA
jgi:nascent polypeptide-associated complex subunit beta